MDPNDVMQTLQRLLATCECGEVGFQRAAAHAQGAGVHGQCLARAAECRQAAADLRFLLAQQDGKAADGGPLPACESAIDASPGLDELALLDACQRLEDTAAVSFHSALADDLPVIVRKTVLRHAQAVQRSQALLRHWRDMRRAAA